jgi:alkanesulfonate monooxygenase SsuD/methylene tetrahydromethanopterin reductase-like flavin-dependent oxidoreductase (luciferase family)
MIPIAARRATGWNVVTSSPDVFVRKQELLVKACRLAGRDPGSVLKSVATIVLGPPPNAEGLLHSYAAWRGLSLEEARTDFISGDEHEVEDRLVAFARVGVDMFIFILKMPIHEELLVWLAERVKRVQTAVASQAKPLGLN